MFAYTLSYKHMNMKLVKRGLSHLTLVNISEFWLFYVATYFKLLAKTISSIH